MAQDPAAEPTGDDDNAAGSARSRDESPTVPLMSVAPVPASPVAPASPALPDVPGGLVPSYGPPSYGEPGYGPPGYGPLGYGQAAYGPAPAMRASTADRDRTIDVLKAAYGEGRLGRQEFEARTAKTMGARTYGELAAVVADLPAGPLGALVAQGPGYYPAMGLSAPTSGMAAGSLACSLAGMVFPLMLVPGVVLGHVARAQIRGTEQRGDGFAVAGLVLGYVGLTLWTLIITLFVTGVW